MKMIFRYLRIKKYNDLVMKKMGHRFVMMIMIFHDSIRSNHNHHNKSVPHHLKYFLKISQ